jgi:hypothetical protein
MAKFALFTPLLGIVLQACLAVLLLRRKIQSLFPMFLVYILFSIAASLAKFGVYSDYRTFYFVYWSTEAVTVVLVTLALLEVFRWLFALFWMSWWFRGLLYTAMMLVLALAVTNAVLSPPRGMHPIGALIYSSAIAVNFMQLAIFAVFWMLSKRLKIGFRRYAFGVMIGFGISSFGTLLARVLRSEFGTKLTFASTYIPPLAYICALGFWLHVFWREEPPEDEWSQPLSPEELTEQMRLYTEQLRRYTKLLKKP